MSVEGGSEYTVMIMLSERTEFVGGEILVRKNSSVQVSLGMSQSDDEEEVEEEDHPVCIGKNHCFVGRFTPDKVYHIFSLRYNLSITDIIIDRVHCFLLKVIMIMELHLWSQARGKCCV